MTVAELRTLVRAARRGIRAAGHPADPTLRRAAAREGACRALGVERLSPAQVDAVHRAAG